MYKHPPWSFDVDRYLNRLVPPPPWDRIPYPVAWFLGYRKEKHRLHDIGNLMPIFWALLGIFASLTIIEAVNVHVPSFQARGAPLAIGSFGAAAVLEFYAIESPLAQPRNAIFGQLISSLVGVAICKLFLLSDNFDDIRFLGGALACAVATALMAITKTVHPPAGATALLAVIDDEVTKLGWFLVPIMMLGAGLMLGTALLVNNFQRRFPVYWWTAEDLTSKKSMLVERKDSPEIEHRSDEEAQTASVEDARAEHSQTTEKLHSSIVIRPGEVIVPEHMYLTQEEKAFLETLSNRL